MKLLKKIILSFIVFFALLCLFIIVCAFRPDLAETLSQFLYPESSESYVTAQIPETGQEENATIASVEIHGEEVPEMTPAAGDAGNLEEAEVYVPPAQSAIKVPKEVAGKSGYRPLQEDSKQIEDAEAAELRNQLGTGESGDGLTFDSQFYPYYAMLSEEQQAVYRQVFANAAALHPSFSPIAEIHDSELRKVMESVYNDHPELFWLDTAYAATVTQNGRCVEISLQSEVDGYSVLSFEDNILGLIKKLETPEESERGLMQWYGDKDSVNEKVLSARPTVEVVDRELMGVLVCRVKGELTPAELDRLKDEMTGQMSDGWGEVAEQREIKTADGELYVSFWNNGNSWSMQTADEMNLQEQQMGGQSL